MTKIKDKVLLMILDGYGEGKKYKGNAVYLSKPKNIAKFRKQYPTTLLKTSGEAVGLPKGYMGGSEVGHFTIGSGRVVFQSLENINKKIKNGEFFRNKEIKGAVSNVKKHKSKLHIIGMISDEGVHSHLKHLFACLELAKKNKIKNVYIHAFTDGRDVPERSADKFIKRVQNQIKKYGFGKIATICGRYYAMDRDQNWKRTKKAYDLLTKGEGFEEKTPLQAIKNAYKRGDETDYYIQPMILDKQGIIEKNDSVVFFNYRTDRAKQLTQVFVDRKFKEFKRKFIPTYFTCFGTYSKIAHVAFRTEKVKNNLGTILSKKGLKQLRIAETEKYAHVTFFFNSQDKEPYKGEDRILVPSPKVPSYADKPEMSAYKVTSKVIAEIKKDKYDFIALNYANPDLVGHSGEIKAGIKACKVVDECAGKVVEAAKKAGYHILITADHGNCEEMIYPDSGETSPAHSLNPVIFILVSDQFKKTTLKKNKGLKDVAPTILQIMGIKKPKEMEGMCLINKK